MTPTKTTIHTICQHDLLAYSHGLRATYGSAALGYARKRAAELAHCGDHDGEAVWHSLAGLLECPAADRT